MTPLSIDYETRSTVNIGAEGAYRYAMHPSTTIYMMGWAFGDEDVEVWAPGRGEPFPERVAEHFGSGGIISAHNAAFERLITWYVLCNDYPEIPEPKMEQFQCNAARARAHGLPGKLADLCRALQLATPKMAEGARLIREYCAQNVLWEDIPEEDQALFIEYCKTDVVVERDSGKCLRALTEHEQYEYQLNEYVNDLGVPVDLKLANAAMGYATEVLDEVDAKVIKLTGGKVKNSRQRKARDEWVIPQLTDDQVLAITNKKKKKISFDSDHRLALSVMPDVPKPVHAYLKLMEEAGGATISKYKAMINREVDGRLPGVLMFNGAGQTGRYSSTGIQLHNLRRDSFDDPEPVIRDLLEGYDLPEVTTTLARLVRSAIYSPTGSTWYDFSAIEGRVAPWLADSKAGRKKLQMYLDGIDPYKVNAADYFNVAYEDVTKDQRQAGKLQELALQFLGGPGALMVMGRNYGIHITQEEGERMRDAWRSVNPWARAFGDELNTVAMRAMMAPNIWQKAGRIAYAYDGGDWLWCKLPSGRLLAYYQPKLEWTPTPWGDEQLSVVCLWGSGKPKVGESWPRRAMHGGLWIENCIGEGTQVLTDAGWKNIECIQDSDRVHDGVEFVAHRGLLFKSTQACVTVDGVHMTPDHEVLTDDGWKTASQNPQPYRPHLRGVDGPSSWAFGRKKTVVGDPLRMRGRGTAGGVRDEKSGGQRADSELRVSEAGGARDNFPRHESASRVLGVAQYARQVSATYASSVAQLRRAWDNRVQVLAGVFREFLGGHGGWVCAGVNLGPQGQFRRVHEGELPLGDAQDTRQKQAHKPFCANPLGAGNGGRGVRTIGHRGNHDTVPHNPRVVGPGRGDRSPEVFKHVYDIRDCGSRQRFVVRGGSGPLIVHNCTQATAADLLREAITRVDDAGLDVVLHVHDEIIIEGFHVEQLGEIMLQPPVWAKGLPLAGEGGSGTRYGK